MSLKQLKKMERDTHPPQRESTVKFNYRARYQATSGVTSPRSVTRSQLLNTFFVNVNGLTSQARILSGVRLKSVEMWAPTGTTGIPTSCSIEWVSVDGPSITHSDVSMSVVPAHVLTQPPSNSRCRFWSLSGFLETEVLFILTYGINCIVDITFEAVLMDDEAANIFLTATNGVQGQLYQTYLDASLGAAAELVPLSYRSIK
jgi:hypothetical protein